MPVTASDGLDASYRFHIGGSTHTLQANYGQADRTRPGGDQTRARRLWGATATSERGPATIRAAYFHARVSDAAFNRLFDAFRQLGPEGVAIAERYDVAAVGYEFLSVGGLYDPGRWFATAEWGTARSRSALGDRSAWYVSAGYRFAKLTPYLTWADVAANSARSDPGLAVAVYPPELAGVVASLNGALNQALAQNPTQHTLSAGVRWDFRANLDLKLQFDHCRLGPGSAGLLGNLQPDFEGGGRYDLISVAVDFVF
jgi:predicted porin